MIESDETKDLDRVPVFGSWKRWYAFLLGFLLVQILLYSWITYAYL